MPECKTIYRCEECRDEFPNYAEAADCEESHVKVTDDSDLWERWEQLCERIENDVTPPPVEALNALEVALDAYAPLTRHWR